MASGVVALIGVAGVVGVGVVGVRLEIWVDGVLRIGLVGQRGGAGAGVQILPVPVARVRWSA